MRAFRVRNGGANALKIDVRPSLGRDVLVDLTRGVLLGVEGLGSLTDGLGVSLAMELWAAMKKVAGRLCGPTDQRTLGQRVDLEEID